MVISRRDDSELWELSRHQRCIYCGQSVDGGAFVEFHLETDFAAHPTCAFNLAGHMIKDAISASHGTSEHIGMAPRRVRIHT